MTTFFTSIDGVEFESYSAVRVSWNNTETGENGEGVFDTGDFVKDWYFSRKFICKQSYGAMEVTSNHSSSVDHVIMDGLVDVESAWLTFVNDEPVLVHEYQENKMEFFVPSKAKNWSWEDLKSYCKS